MPITQIPSGFVAKQPKLSVYYNGSTANGTYYTALDVTSRGKISKITLLGNNLLSGNLYIRATIDGVSNIINPSYSNAVSVGLNHNTISANNNYSGTVIDYFCDIFFYNSCKVEFMQNAGTGSVLEGSIMYSTE